MKKEIKKEVKKDILTEKVEKLGLDNQVIEVSKLSEKVETLNTTPHQGRRGRNK